MVGAAPFATGAAATVVGATLPGVAPYAPPDITGRKYPPPPDIVPPPIDMAPPPAGTIAPTVDTAAFGTLLPQDEDCGPE